MRTNKITINMNKLIAVSQGLVCLAIAGLAVGNAQAALSLSSPTSDGSWSKVTYNNGEPPTDQQTGQPESDLVSDTANPFFYTQFDDAGTSSLTDGTMAFRFRMNDTAKQGYNGSLFAGIDANNDGLLDVFVGVNRKKKAGEDVGIWMPTGPIGSEDTLKSQGFGAFRGGAAGSSQVGGAGDYTVYPADESNYYDHRIVTSADVNGGPLDLDPTNNGNPDYYISFAVDFAALVAVLGEAGITIDQETALRYVAGTSEQGNSFNQDLGGVGVNFDGSLPWSELGVVSDPVTATGRAVAVPEPAGAMLSALGGALLMLRRRRKA